MRPPTLPAIASSSARREEDTHREYTPAMRTAIVTGASSGIGKATSLRLARDGFSVLAVGRDARALEAICDTVRSSGGRAAFCAADVTSADGPGSIVRKAAAEFGSGLDALVNAAGII